MVIYLIYNHNIFTSFICTNGLDKIKMLEKYCFIKYYDEKILETKDKNYPLAEKVFLSFLKIINFALDRGFLK